jgi:hypothetical protein
MKNQLLPQNQKNVTNTCTERDRSSQIFLTKAQTTDEKGNPQYETPKPEVTDSKTTGTSTHVDQTTTQQQQQ